MSISAERYVFIVKNDKLGRMVWPSSRSGTFLLNDFFYGRQFDWNGTNVIKYDLKNKRIFLKRCVYEALKVENLYLDSVFMIYSR